MNNNSDGEQPSIFTDVDKSGTIRHYKNGILHCEDGPAVIYSNGSSYWFIDGKRHREDGPATVTLERGIDWWYQNIHYNTVQEYAIAAGWSDKQLADWLLSN